MADTLSVKLEKLRAQYINSLQGKVAGISLLVKQLRTKEWDMDKQDTLINLVHRLSGSGKTFKVEGLSECAFAFERFLRKKLREKRLISLSIKKTINGYVEKLDEISREAAGKEAGTLMDEPVQYILKTGNGEGKQVFLFFNGERVPPVEDQFKLYGYEIIRFDNVDKLDDYPVTGKNTIIVVDIQLLENDSQALEKIRHISEQKKDMHIVAFSDYDTMHKRLVAAKVGADVFLTSPFDVPLLISKLTLISQNRGSEPYHILIVDDDVEYVAWCAYTLQQEGMITSVVSRPEQVISQLIESRPELVLMDWHMPRFTGFDLASIIRQQDAFISIPIIFLTTENDPEKRMQAMKIGADDFLIKPVSSRHLIETVRIRAERYRTLRFYMERDSLTGLYNHSKILEYLSSEFTRTQRYKAVLSFAMVDIDHFKQINDTYGHLNGDRVLKDLANLFKERLRKNDLIGRYGGEEFAVIFPNTGPQAVVKVLNEIREGFSRIKHCAEDKCFSVTFSAGITSSLYCTDTLNLVNISDMALYKAKSSGRNRVVLVDIPDVQKCTHNKNE